MIHKSAREATVSESDRVGSEDIIKQTTQDRYSGDSTATASQKMIAYDIRE